MTSSGYPAAARSDLREDLHGHLVADPYRDLEDPGGAAAGRGWTPRTSSTRRPRRGGPAASG